MEDAVNATKAAIEEGVVVGVGCCLLRLSLKVNEIKKLMDNEEQKVLSNDDVRYGYNAASNEYGDLMAAGIIDPTKVVRCCIEHAASVAKTFLTSDAVVIDIDGPLVKGMRPPKQTPKPTPMSMPLPTQMPMQTPMPMPSPMQRPMPSSGY